MPWTLALTFLLGALGAPGGQDDRQRAVGLATETLATVLKIARDAIRLASVEAVDWPNPGLGCPERGAVYPQVITPGYRVRLRVDDREHVVHTGRGRAVVCVNGAPADAAATTARPSIAPALAASETARRHLANALAMPADEIRIERVRRWRTSDRGCNPTDVTAVRGETFLVELKRGATSYRYRATPDVAWPCK